MPLYKRLGSPEIQAAAEACEAKTNPRLHALERLHVVLGDGSTFAVKTDDVRHYGAVARSRFERFVAAAPGLGVPEPCGHCGFCRWNSECKDHWDAAEHLSLVAGISRGQRAKLRDAGIVSLRALAHSIQGPADLQAATHGRLGS